MGQEIIKSAKEIIMKGQKAKLLGDVKDGSDPTLMTELAMHYKVLQAQVQSLESKIELVLRKLN